MLLYLFLAVIILIILWLIITDPYVVSKVEAGWDKLEKVWLSIQKFSSKKRRIALIVLVVILVAAVVYLLYSQSNV